MLGEIEQKADKGMSNIKDIPNSLKLEKNFSLVLPFLSYIDKIRVNGISLSFKSLTKECINNYLEVIYYP